MKINRALFTEISNEIVKGTKISALYGPRQSGKTTLAQDIIQALDLKTLKVNADQKIHHDVFSSRNLNTMKSFVAGYDLLFIDEAQRIPDIGISIKILKDNIPSLKIFITGSSSLDLANKIKEPLTGRIRSFKLFPLALLEITKHLSLLEIEEQLPQILQYGLYPEVFTSDQVGLKEQILAELTDSYLYKDILELEEIRYPHKLKDLLRLLAFQVGSEVSIEELARNLGINRVSVERYIWLLEESFVLFRLSGFSRNLRKEITKMDKIYFYDIGVRNILIDNCKPPALRNDTGALWENFLIAERMKKLHYRRKRASRFFWRTYTGAELDYIEEYGGNLYGYEIKFSSKQTRPPQTWLTAYPGSRYKCITKTNYHDFIL